MDTEINVQLMKTKEKQGFKIPVALQLFGKKQEKSEII